MADLLDDKDSYASPLSHARRKRRAKSARLRHSKQFQAFLKAQATRLSSDTSVIFAKVEKYGADRVRAAANLAAIP